MIKEKNLSYEITPPKSFIHIDFGQLWRFRELFYIFTWRDIKVRYKQTIVGVSWVVFQPLLMMLIFTVFFGILAKIPSQGTPYPIFVYSGLLFWNYFSSALTNSSNSLVESQEMIKKVYFPRMILPISATLAGLIDLVISFIVLLLLMAAYHFSPHLIGIVLVPMLMLLTLLLAASLGLILSSINVKYRDVRAVLPYFIQIIFFLTPVIYPPTLIPQRFSWLLLLNPMTGIISACRASLLGQTPINWLGLGISVLIIFILAIFGLYYFKKTESFFADIV